VRYVNQAQQGRRAPNDRSALDPAGQQ